MPDYGQPLRFGTFITPRNSPPQYAVDLAKLSEEVGFDLVTFQDHPYQPAFHDTWTLMTWVAAQTSSIHLSGNVMNLPLRQPAVLARSIASLDLLSEGRVALGLGAGGMWDPIVAMGEPRLTMGEAVAALGQAIDIIRGIWDPSDRSPLRAGGEFHSVDGAKRGPAPAHDVPIWLGAYKPRMQRLIGRKADGWLPSLPYMQPGDLARGNEIIDAAAQEAGRDPRDITRLLNITPRETADDLVQLATEDGISVFILASDEPDAIRGFAENVIPEVRERLAGKTSSSTPAPSRRVPGIDYEAIPPSLAERAIEPGADGYARYKSSYLRGGAPGLVLRPRTPEEVQDAVRYAALQRDVPLGILSAGHGISGRSLNRGGLVIDVSALNHIEPLEGRRVRIGPGARWLDVARTLTPLGLAITSGDYGGVGVGGLATAGGIGWFAREHGLTIDHIRSVDVVTADGELVHASAEHEPDLFWAMRGAGANFGIAVSFELEADEVGEIAFAQLVFATEDVADFLERWGEAIETSHRSVTGTALLGAGQPGATQYVRALVAVDSDDPETIIERLQPIAQVGQLVDQSVQLTTYASVMELGGVSDTQHGQGEPLSHSGSLRHITPEVASGMAAMLEARAAFFVAIRSTGGAVGDIPAEATAYAWRDTNFSVGAFGTRTSGLDEWWAKLLPSFEGMYLSFETETGPDVVARAFPPAHLERLRELKRTYDPTGLFRDNFFIEPAEPIALTA